MTQETNKGCCEKCKCPDDCDQPGEHCRVIRNGKPACPCHLPTEKGLCEHGNESWDCTQCIRKALTPEKGDKTHTDIEGVAWKIIKLLFPEGGKIGPNGTFELVCQILTALVEGARERGYLEGRDDEHVVSGDYERGRADGKRERDAELRQEVLKIPEVFDQETRGGAGMIETDDILSLLTLNDKQPKS